MRQRRKEEDKEKKIAIRRGRIIETPRELYSTKKINQYQHRVKVEKNFSV